MSASILEQDPNTKSFKQMLIYFNMDTQYAQFLFFFFFQSYVCLHLFLGMQNWQIQITCGLKYTIMCSHYFTSEDDFAQLIVWKPGCNVCVSQSLFHIKRMKLSLNSVCIHYAWEALNCNANLSFHSPCIHDEIIIGSRWVSVHWYIYIYMRKTETQTDRQKQRRRDRRRRREGPSPGSWSAGTSSCSRDQLTETPSLQYSNLLQSKAQKTDKIMMICHWTPHFFFFLFF